VRKAVVVLGALALCALSTGVATPAAPAEPLRMTVGAVGTIGSLDPRTGDSTIAREVWNIQYQTLTATDPVTRDPTVGVAIAWNPLPSGRGWTYELRPNLAWSDGRLVTAADVVYSLDHARDDNWPYARGMLDGLTARAIDAHTVVVTARSKTHPLPGLLLHVVPAHVYEQHANVSDDVTALGVGDGPWHIVSKSADSVELGVLGRPGGPPLDQIVFRSYPNTNALIDALARGDVDVIGDVSDSEVDRLHQLDGVTVNPGPDAAESRTVEAFRTDNVTGFLPDPARPSLVVFGPTVRQYSGIVAAHLPPGEQLSNATYAIGVAVLLALAVAGYFVAARVRRRYVT
jgi:peptide/nickel transport system substrate-binding protein